ncbi:DUF6502 family protein [Teredinibacter sp. KSP-S5-2]|uniref:DUF6502 family protein n=1 Tax=Teredinibacter sp. KSP-S5-2 TaxID=3034506 RepID=UPI002934ADF0|nr:DUF6502 family protein [Teredinibacter sp. KSP-S5-2]WNO09799.1 DUF6502 family protein [Teredinibacter sp. KSP-S5-2]
MKMSPHQQAQDALLNAAKLLLRPFVRLMIQYQLTFPRLRDLLKEVYVDVARSMITQDGEEPTDSRIYILTGVHRKDIKRLREQENEVLVDVPAGLSLGGAIVAQWMGNAKFLDKSGLPRPLERNGDSESPGFDWLVASVSKDVRPRAMLDELLRQNMVSVMDDKVVLNTSAFVPAEDMEKLCNYFGHNVHDHIGAAAHNIAQQGGPWLERSVYYGKLTEESVNELREMGRLQAESILTDINKKALVLRERDQNNPNAKHRFRLGCYWFEQDDQS